MTSLPGVPDQQKTLDRVHQWAGGTTLWLFVGVLAWAPFPLGGAISWGAGLQEMLIAVCWLSWTISIHGRRWEDWSEFRPVLVPLALGLIVLCWAGVQMLPITPASWAHPIWALASDTLGQNVPAVISLNPWRTETELLKLGSYIAACWLAFSLARRSDAAAILLNAVIAIGAFYALYALVLALIGIDQTKIFYSVPFPNSLISGPFMLHNSFATYSGLAALAAIAKLFAMGSQSIVAGRGARNLALTIVQFAFGRGAFLLVAVLLTFAGVVASASRAGFAAIICGFAALALASLLMTRHRRAGLWTAAGSLLAVLPLLFLIAANGDTLGDRLGQLLDTGTADNIRLALWPAARRMISDAPWLGLGLGTFQDAYPLYATQVLPYVMDKAHCDYLEFAAGVGLPAAIAWWSAMLWLFFLCLRGVRVRRRNRLYPLVAVGASVLVAVHSSVDFSLQIPAVALSYATLFGIGVAQALPTRTGPYTSTQEHHMWTSGSKPERLSLSQR
jgi:O-antigen ligase